MYRDKKVVVVMPAYNAAKTLRQTHAEVCAQQIVDKIILVDDQSRDDTVSLARTLPGIEVHVHETNTGYGGNQKTCYRLALAAALVVACAVPGWAKDPVYRLSIGDPARRDKDAAVTLDAITDTATGETIAPAELGARLAKARLLLVGETHTSIESHRVELQVIKALADAGSHVTIALEMFPYPSQPALDTWNQGAESTTSWSGAARTGQYCK